MTQWSNLCHNRNLCSFFPSRQNHTDKGCNKQPDMRLQSYHWKDEAYSNSKIFWISEIWKHKYWNWQRSLHLSLHMMKLKRQANPKCLLQNKILQHPMIKRLSLWKSSQIFKKYSSKRWGYLKMKESKVKFYLLACAFTFGSV